MLDNQLVGFYTAPTTPIKDGSPLEGARNVSEGKLVPSSNSGRYAINDPETGSEVTNGQVCEVFLGWAWIPGNIEHSGNLYAIEGTAQQAFSGYYFISDAGGVCGLCIDMKVRICS